MRGKLRGHLLQRVDGLARCAADRGVQAVQLGLDVVTIIRQQLCNVHQLARHHPAGDRQSGEEDQDDQDHRDGTAEPPALQQRNRGREQEVEHQREGHRG